MAVPKWRPSRQPRPFLNALRPQSKYPAPSHRNVTTNYLHRCFDFTSDEPLSNFMGRQRQVVIADDFTHALRNTVRTVTRCAGIRSGIQAMVFQVRSPVAQEIAAIIGIPMRTLKSCTLKIDRRLPTIRPSRKPGKVQQSNISSPKSVLWETKIDDRQCRERYKTDEK